MNGTEPASLKQPSHDKKKKKKISISEILSLELSTEPNEAEEGAIPLDHSELPLRRSRSERRTRHGRSNGELRR